jgi:hypothetical protein
MARTLELPDDLYTKLEEAAETEGVSPAQWIGARLPNAFERKPNREILDRYIGAFDSSMQTPDPKYRTPFGDIVAEKLRKQGLEIP